MFSLYCAVVSFKEVWCDPDQHFFRGGGINFPIKREIIDGFHHQNEYNYFRL